ncbi:hypothetical protein IID62_00445 [candidate division KSB1 bacterium]|nr:hypothetical protein [candidate division KSB1 bacterium]
MWVSDEILRSASKKMLPDSTANDPFVQLLPPRLNSCKAQLTFPPASMILFSAVTLALSECEKTIMGTASGNGGSRLVS